MLRDEAPAYAEYGGISISDTSPPLSRALLIHRVINGLLLFMLPVIVGAQLYLDLPGRTGGFWQAWTNLSHIVIVTSVILSVKQYKVVLFKASMALQAVWLLVGFALLITVAKTGSRTATRIGVPMVLFFILLQALDVLSAILVCREPVRPPVSERNSRKQLNNEYEFGIWDETEESDHAADEPTSNNQSTPATGSSEDVTSPTSNGSPTDADHDDGLATQNRRFREPSSPSLYSALSTPSGIPRRVPVILQTLAIGQCVLWPFYFLDVILSFMASWSASDGRSHPNTAYLAGLTITYHYAMLIWMIGSVIVSFGYRNKRRLWFAAHIGLVYLAWCFIMAILKISLWSIAGNWISPALSVCHIIILAPWCALAYYIGVNYYDYTHVPTCCC